MQLEPAGDGAREVEKKLWSRRGDVDLLYAPLEEYVERLDAELDARAGAVIDDARAAAADADGASPATPFVGLVPYGEGDAAFFFGRDEEKADRHRRTCARPA